MKKILILSLLFGMLLPIVHAAYYQTYVEVEITGLSWLWDGEVSTGPYIKERHDWCIPIDTNMSIASRGCTDCGTSSLCSGCHCVGNGDVIGDATRNGFLKPMCKGDTMISNLVQIKSSECGKSIYSYQVQLDRGKEYVNEEIMWFKPSGTTYTTYSCTSNHDNNLCFKKYCLWKYGYYDGYFTKKEGGSQNCWNFNDINKNFNFGGSYATTLASGCNGGQYYGRCLKEAPIDLRINFTG